MSCVPVVCCPDPCFDQESAVIPSAGDEVELHPLVHESREAGIEILRGGSGTKRVRGYEEEEEQGKRTGERHSVPIRL